jgi:signal transduction histidine kinase
MEADGDRPRRHRAGSGLGVRVRITVSALVVVAAMLVVAGLGLVWTFHRTLTDGVVASSTTQAEDIGALAREGTLPTTLAVKADSAAVAVDAAGGVLSTSAPLADVASLTRVRPALGAVSVFSAPPSLPGDDDDDIAVATTVATASGPVTIYVLAADEQIEDPVRDLIVSLVVAFPILVVLAGALSWILAGRALRPVEVIRSEVADLSASDLHRRVPVPAGHDEVARLARTMNDLLARLETASARQNRFVSDASHELRSPIAAVLAQVEVAQAHPEGVEWSAVAASVRDEVTRLSRLVDDLLVLARSDEGQLLAGHDPVDLDELVLAESDRLRAQHKVAVDIRSLSAGRVTGDREQLRRMVRNLVDNAERHAEHTVWLGVSRSNGTVELTVADDGPGIARGDRDRVFERFTRLDESRDRPTGGTGLGLAIVGEIVDLYGGSVHVADSPVGARFVVRLPAAPQ